MSSYFGPVLDFAKSVLTTVNPSNLAKGAEEIILNPAKPECGHADVICELGEKLGLEVKERTPEFIQNGLQKVEDLTGISPEVSSVAIPVVSGALIGGSVYAINKHRAFLSTIVSEAVFNAIQENQPLVKLVKSLDKEALDMLNRFPANGAVLLAQAKPETVAKLAKSKNKAIALQQAAQAHSDKFQLLDAPAETKAVSDAKKPKQDSYLVSFAKFGYSKLPATNGSYNPVKWTYRAPKA